ncbi:MAG: hypothetical protein P1U87_02650 [Verrucomicrobiales bacterium]|nr:hypothetical protein [Verrucomicrobiales bacterium]
MKFTIASPVTQFGFIAAVACCVFSSGGYILAADVEVGVEEGVQEGPASVDPEAGDQRLEMIFLEGASVGLGGLKFDGVEDSSNSGKVSREDGKVWLTGVRGLGNPVEDGGRSESSENEGAEAEGELDDSSQSKLRRNSGAFKRRVSGFIPTMEVSLSSTAVENQGSLGWRNTLNLLEGDEGGDADVFASEDGGYAEYESQYPASVAPYYSEDQVWDESAGSYSYGSEFSSQDVTRYGNGRRRAYNRDLYSYEFDTNLSFADREFSEEDADIKLGPLFFQLSSVEAGAFYYDSEGTYRNGDEDGWGSFVGFRFRALAQLSSKLYLTSDVGIFYLPDRDRWIFDVGNQPVLDLRFRDTWGLWDVEIYDTLRLSTPYAAGVNDYSDYFIFGYQLRDEADGFYNQAYWSNQVGITGERQLSEDWMMVLEADHTDYWYADRFSDEHQQREHFGVLLDSKGSYIPFAPFFRYDFNYFDHANSLIHQTRIGGDGRIAENLRLSGSVGYFWGDSETVDYEGTAWDVGLDHSITEFTVHGVRGGQDYYANDFTPDSAVTEYIRYYLNHRFTRVLSATAFAQWSVDDVVSGPLAGRTFDRESYALLLNYSDSPFLRFNCGVYREVREDLGSRADFHSWRYIANATARINLDYSVYFRYEYEDASDFDETLFVSGIRRYF